MGQKASDLSAVGGLGVELGSKVVYIAEPQLSYAGITAGSSGSSES